VLLLKSETLADSICSMPCTTARPAAQSFVEYQRIMPCRKRKTWTVTKFQTLAIEHPGIVADSQQPL